MKITLIAAVAEDSTIATENGIPWDIPEDRAHLRSYCADKPLIVGRRTYEEMDGWFLVGHTPIVITSDPDYLAHTPGTLIAESIPTAVAMARVECFEEIVVIGGASIYAAAIGHATDLVITRVEGSYGGRFRFPEIDEAIWKAYPPVPLSEDPRAEVVSYTRATG